MSGAPFHVAPLDAAHDHAAFAVFWSRLIATCESKSPQDIRRRVVACFVALADGQRIAGYYTLASASLLLADFPASTGKKLPRYPTLPAVGMRRLTVDRAFKGQGPGGDLLAERSPVPPSRGLPP